MRRYYVVNGVVFFNHEEAIAYKQECKQAIGYGELDEEVIYLFFQKFPDPSSSKFQCYHGFERLQRVLFKNFTPQ